MRSLPNQEFVRYVTSVISSTKWILRLLNGKKDQNRPNGASWCS
jgi:hypothetical protein